MPIRKRENVEAPMPLLGEEARASDPSRTKDRCPMSNQDPLEGAVLEAIAGRKWKEALVALRALRAEGGHLSDPGLEAFMLRFILLENLVQNLESILKGASQPKVRESIELALAEARSALWRLNHGDPLSEWLDTHASFLAHILEGTPLPTGVGPDIASYALTMREYYLACLETKSLATSIGEGDSPSTTSRLTTGSWMYIGLLHEPPLRPNEGDIIVDCP